MLRGHNSQAEPYVSKTSNLRKRLIRLLGANHSLSKRLSLREHAAEIEYTVTGSDFEAGLLLYRTWKREFPLKYRERAKLKFAPLIKLAWENAYPRAYITRKIGRKAAYYGPFASRAAAEKFLSDSLDLFKVRRCTFELNPHPAFPGCVYSEMRMCLAPCFKGCTDEEYGAEVQRLGRYLDSCGESLIGELSEKLEQLSAELKFEEAAGVHTKIEKVKAIVSGCPEIVHRLDRLRAVILQPSAEQGCVSIFFFQDGTLSGPIQFSVAPMQPATAGFASPQVQPHLAQPIAERASVAGTKPGKPATLEARVLESVVNIERQHPPSNFEWMENLAFLTRWYYRSRKLGEVFFADERGDLPLRRIVRGISRVYHGEKEPTNASEIQIHAVNSPKI